MIAIVDYQMGNLRSVQKAFERVGQQAVVTGDPDVIVAAERVVLPGVGAFGDAMHELTTRGLVPVLREVIDTGKPFLGICLGLQLLFDVSYEDGTHEGLGVIPGEVVRFDLGDNYKVPHMGWNQVQARRAVPLVEGDGGGLHYYFVHSYYVVPRDPQWVALETDYGGPFCSMVHRDRLVATQFHPEKSQQQGLAMLARFAEL